MNHKKSTGSPLAVRKDRCKTVLSWMQNKEEVISMLERGDTVFEICKRFNVSRNTYYMFKRNYGL